ADVRPGSGLRARIEKFNPSGGFLGQVLVPTSSGSAAFSSPITIDVDSAGRVFASLTNNKAVEAFQPSDFGGAETGPEFGVRDVFHEQETPVLVAVSPVDQKIWISDTNGIIPGGAERHICGEAGAARRAILAYDAAGRKLDCTAPLEPSGATLPSA